MMEPTGFSLIKPLSPDGPLPERVTGIALILERARTAHRQCSVAIEQGNFLRALTISNIAGDSYLEVIEQYQQEIAFYREALRAKRPTAAPNNVEVQELERRQENANALLEQAHQEYRLLTEEIKSIRLQLDIQSTKE